MNLSSTSSFEVRHRTGFPFLRPLPFLALGLQLASLAVRATPPFDPICGTPNSLDRVMAIRAERAPATKARHGTIRLQGPEAQPRLSLNRSHPLDPPRLILQGAVGRTYHLEATPNLASQPWAPVLSVVMGEQPLAWSDGIPGKAASAFFRLRSDVLDVPEAAANFRLLDTRGVARDLYYHTELEGIAVLAAGTNLSQIAPLAPLLGELSRTYTSEIRTWILLSDPLPVRSNVLAQASALGLDFPVLLDSYGLAARSVGLTRVGQVALIRSPDFTVAYRGEVAGPDASTTAGSLLGQAMAGLVDRTPVTFLRTPALGAPLDHVNEPTPDYAREIAPILHEYCVKCHYSGGVAPFALTNHSVAEAWAPSIKHAILSGQMPPWHADPEYGRFANDLSLPGHLKSSLIRWLDAGAPRGNGADPLAELPARQAFAGWPEELGEPDALVRVPVQSIKATGVEPYRYLYAQTPNPTNVWLRAAIIRPSNYKSVHHYLIWLGRIGNNGTPDNSSYQPHIAEFVPGYEPRRFPADAGVFLSRSNWLTFNLHYTPNGIETNDQPVLALWYHRSKPTKTWNLAAPLNNVFVIPPGAPDHPVQATWTTPNTPIEIHRLNPHMHLRGKRARFEVRYPNGDRETLLSVPDYDFNWQVGYTLAKPKSIPAGSQIIVSGAFDNSPQNLANPDPTAQVRWGDQSWMEMFAGHIDYTQ